MDKPVKKTILQRVWGWTWYLALIGLILYFFAPSSWFQFGVTSVKSRKHVAAFSLGQRNAGEDWNFADKRGKVILVNYWATWCGPCRYETPGLVDISNEFKDREFEIVGVTVDHDLERVPTFIESYKIRYPILLPGNDPNIGDGGMKLPTTFLYDKQGRLAKKYDGIVLEWTLRSDIESLLAEK